MKSYKIVLAVVFLSLLMTAGVTSTSDESPQAYESAMPSILIGELGHCYYVGAIDNEFIVCSEVELQSPVVVVTHAHDGPKEVVVEVEVEVEEEDVPVDEDDIVVVEEEVVTVEEKIKSNNGHGNNVDGVDCSNPGKKKVKDSDPSVDDEKVKKDK